jgi:hypothetical protein
VPRFPAYIPANSFLSPRLLFVTHTPVYLAWTASSYLVLHPCRLQYSNHSTTGNPFKSTVSDVTRFSTRYLILPNRNSAHGQASSLQCQWTSLHPYMLHFLFNAPIATWYKYTAPGATPSRHKGVAFSAVPSAHCVASHANQNPTCTHTSLSRGDVMNATCMRSEACLKC